MKKGHIFLFSKKWGGGTVPPCSAAPAWQWKNKMHMSDGHYFLNDTSLMNTKMLIDCVPRKRVFRGPLTVGVSLAFVTTNIGSLGFMKHTVFVKHSK